MNIKRTAKYILLAALAIIAIWVLFVAFIVGVPVVEEYVSRRDFDSELWKKAEVSSDEIRIKMVDDLLQKHPLVGMSRSEVEGLLGRPKVTGYFSDYEYVYWLGPERSFVAIDSEWLGLKFKDDVVSKATILRD